MEVLREIAGFRIERELGRGGMGEVYLARDVRLDRAVAIKALPAYLSADPDRLARFQREAKVLASLNHPGIGAIYGLEEAGGHQYLILEYVEGETLAQTLERGAVPVDEALGMARQIAEALEAAHEKGVVHRDLKPGNVMVNHEGVVKVLDFGLARTGEGAASTSGAFASPDSPTVASPAPVHSPTIPGAIMGTAGYMSPEQARGKSVDKRSDIFSFGCVLYEMLTGTQAFGGDTVTDSLGAILHKEPEWSHLPASTPPRIRDLLSSCLVKDRRQRLHDIGDARIAIENAGRDGSFASAGATRGRGREAAAWIAAIVGIGAAVGAWAMRPSGSAGSDDRVLRFTVPAPAGVQLNPETVNASVSPDGRRLAFIAAEPAGADRLWVRDFDSVTSRALEGTEGAAMPFWSPDSRSVAFFTNGMLCRISAEGGPVQRIADAPGGRGGDWSEAGVILFAPLANGALHVVAQSGGTSTAATTLDAKNGETGQRFPQFLPGGRSFLYASMGPRDERGWQEHTFVGSLDSKESHAVCAADARATFAPGGWLLIERSGTLYAQRFDVKSGTTSGEEFATGILPGGQNKTGGTYSASVSRNGVVICPIDSDVKLNCVEIGAGGQIVRTLSAKPELYESLRVSPTGDALVSVVTPINKRSELRLIDLGREGVWSRLVEDPNVLRPFFSPDGQWVYYSTDRTWRNIFRCSTAGTGKPEPVFEPKNLWANARDVSADGALVIFSTLDPTNGRDLWVMDTASKGVRPLAVGPANEFEARLSPDGRLIAIASDESGKPELYVQDFPEGKARVRVSFSGITNFYAGSPNDACFRWSKDGNSLMFLDADRRTIRSAVIVEKPALHAAKPEVLMQAPAGLACADIAPDGKSVFGVIAAEGQAACSIAVTMNWTGQIRGTAQAGAKR